MTAKKDETTVPLTSLVQHITGMLDALRAGLPLVTATAKDTTTAETKGNAKREDDGGWPLLQPCRELALEERLRERVAVVV